MRLTPLALAAGLLAGAPAARAQGPATAPVPAAAPAARPASTPGPAPGPASGPGLAAAPADALPITLQADEIRARPDLEAVAEGAVQFRRGALFIGADRLSYDSPEDLAVARGHVRIERDGAVYTGPELQLRVQRFEGFFLEPRFEFLELGAGGRADRIDFIDADRSQARNAWYTSCPRETGDRPAWLLQADRVRLDLAANEGVAEGAVLRFLGAPILALPTLSFPLTDERKSGWLPPSIGLDSRSGLELSLPWYWNIAPQRDATFAPRLITRRGLALDAEFRYLEPRWDGVLDASLLPDDRIAGRSRQALQWRHQGELPRGLRYAVDLRRVSDDAWWKDFPDGTRSLTPRLLSQRAEVERPFALAGGEGTTYVRMQRWQVLQGSDSLLVAPWQRSPQVGARWSGALPRGLELSLQAEYNRFTRPSADEGAVETGRLATRPLLAGQRVHAIGALAWPWRVDGGWVVPRLTLNAAQYRTEAPMDDGRTSAGRVLPTLSVDAGLEFERATSAFGRALRQTLEPRLLYVHTPYRAQSLLPNYDAAARDFNFGSIYSDNAFTGVDRVSDSHQVTVGATTRLVDSATGAETLRLGAVQRVLLREQRVAPQSDGSADGPPLTQRFSDLLLLGSTSVLPGWQFDGALQYSPDLSRAVRSIVSARYSPGPFRTVGATYRLARGLSEQLEVGWQWPLRGAGAGRSTGAAAGGAGARCSGTLYGVGRFNYSIRDSRVTDSIAGLEYDAGCWIGRVVAERLSTGRSEATTRLLVQLELVGLSRLGSNPLRVLKDNIPGYRLLREDRRESPPGAAASPLP